jgi:serine protease Do
MRSVLFLLLVSLMSLSPLYGWGQTKTPTLKLGSPLPENLFVELARVINPAVVNISTSTVPKGRMMNDPMLEMLEQFYGQRFQMPKAKPQTALGTGFIIRDDGLIITNNHVIEGADVIQVQLTEGSEKEFKAEVIGRDQRTDIALIKITSKQKFPIAPLGSSADVEVGEWVAAFGNPYGHGHTMTKGIISAKGREIGELNRFPFLQTDASINPGNSGGPLVNSKGFVIGVNSAIDARAQGIGFAIPIDDVKNVIKDLETNGHVRQGYIGVGLDELNPRAAAHLGIKKEEGVIITQVMPGSPADKAGIETYDVVLEFNGKKIATSVDFMNAVAGAPLNQVAKMKVLRDNKERVLDVSVSERPDEKAKVAKKTQTVKGQETPFNLGFKMATVDGNLIKEWQISEDLTGLPVVTEVLSGSPAAFAGLRPGDVIYDVNRKRVRSVAEATKALQKGTNTLRIQRDGGMGFIILEGK